MLRIIKCLLARPTIKSVERGWIKPASCLHWNCHALAPPSLFPSFMASFTTFISLFLKRYLWDTFTFAYGFCHTVLSWHLTLEKLMERKKNKNHCEDIANPRYYSLKIPLFNKLTHMLWLNLGCKETFESRGFKSQPHESHGLKFNIDKQ